MAAPGSFRVTGTPSRRPASLQACWPVARSTEMRCCRAACRLAPRTPSRCCPASQVRSQAAVVAADEQCLRSEIIDSQYVLEKVLCSSQKGTVAFVAEHFGDAAGGSAHVKPEKAAKQPDSEDAKEVSLQCDRLGFALRATRPGWEGGCMLGNEYQVIISHEVRTAALCFEQPTAWWMNSSIHPWTAAPPLTDELACARALALSLYTP